MLTGLVAELRKVGAEPKTEAWVRVVYEWRSQFPLHFWLPDAMRSICGAYSAYDWQADMNNPEAR